MLRKTWMLVVVVLGLVGYRVGTGGNADAGHWRGPGVGQGWRPRGSAVPESERGRQADAWRRTHACRWSI